ncbi:MAG TPA: PDZ domain-containing protein [Isosphaeraceae bacterium]|nr:PDZ domain-containing protein [Isosphaeraceae bacterium]
MRPSPRRLATIAALLLPLAALAPDDPKPKAETARDPQVGRSFRVPYKMTGTNHFLVRIRINGKGPFNFLVDTGAPALFVSTHAAKAVGLAAPKDEFWAVVDRLDFEGGPTLRGVKARVEDPFQLIGMNALGLPGHSIDGILGFTILARYKMTIDPTQDRMTWTRLDYDPKEPFIPRGAIAKQAPAELEAMNLLGPLAKFAAVLVGKQEPDKLIPRGRLGIILEEAGGPARVASVLDSSPAARAGVKPGDVIAAIDGKSVDSPKAAMLAAAKVRAGAAVALKIKRDGATIDVPLIAGEGF